MIDVYLHTLFLPLLSPAAFSRCFLLVESIRATSTKKRIFVWNDDGIQNRYCRHPLALPLRAHFRGLRPSRLNKERMKTLTKKNHSILFHYFHVNNDKKQTQFKGSLPSLTATRGMPAADTNPKPPDFSCSICFDVATEPVVTKCGHLFCWSCLDEWLKKVEECPMCKGRVNGETPGDIIPLYGKGTQQSSNASHRPAPKGSASSEHSAAPAPPPPRPHANREAPPPRRGNNVDFRWGGGLFLFGTPMISWEWMILFGMLVLGYQFAPWRRWLGLENAPPQGAEGMPQDREREGGGVEGAAGNARNGEGRNTHMVILIFIFVALLWITSPF